MAQTIMDKLNWLGRFSLYVLKRFQSDGCKQTATALSYTTLLSLVPMFSVGFAIFSSFPGFHDLFEQFQSFIFNNFVPTSGEVVQDYLAQFVSKAKQATMVGIIVLVGIALLLMYTIDSSLNKIWKNKRKRSIGSVLLIYWAVLTLSPVFMGISISVSSYLTSMTIFSDTFEFFGAKKVFLSSIPSFFTFIAFSLIYLVVPNAPVKIRHAAVGGLTAMVLFELSKRGFATYVSQFASYEAIYGALATIPIFLIWIYIAWLVTLLGAETTRALATFNENRDLQRTTRGRELLVAIEVLHILWQRQHEGQGATFEQLMRRLKNYDDLAVRNIIDTLEEKKWLHISQRNQYYVSRDLREATFFEFYRALPYDLPGQGDELVGPLVEEANSNLETLLSQPIHELFSTSKKSDA